MNQRIKVKVKPGGTVLFPDICTNCSKPASERMVVRKRNGRITRTIDLPVCAECFRELHRESAEEERMRAFGRLGSVGGGLLILLLLLIILPDGFIPLWRIVFSLAAAAGLGAAIYFYFDRRRRQGARPEKQAVESSAAIVDFSWRATTFDFREDAFAEQFEELNQQQLMEF